MVAAIQDDVAIHHNGGDTDRVLVRVVVGRALGEAGRVEHRHVRPASRSQHAAIGKSERRR